MKTADFGPGTTPAFVKWFLIIVTTICTLSGVVQGFLHHLNIFPGPQEIFSLSWWGFSGGYLWQPITYAFLLDLPFNDITFSFFTSLIFYMYIFWVLGSAVNLSIGTRSFAQFLAICIVVTGFLTIVMLRLFGNYDMITGLVASTIIVITAWCLRFPNTPIFLFMLIPINSITLASTLVIVIIGYSFFEGEFVNVLLYITAVIVSYLYASLVWGWRTPFTSMKRIDDWLLHIRGAFTHNHATYEGNKEGATIIDIDTGQPTKQDDEFVEEMLEKIAKQGEDSLSWRERQRLQKISEKKKNQ